MDSAPSSIYCEESQPKIRHHYSLAEPIPVSDGIIFVQEEVVTMSSPSLFMSPFRLESVTDSSLLSLRLSHITQRSTPESTFRDAFGRDAASSK